MIARRVSLGVGANVYDKLVIAGVQLALVPVLATHWGLNVYGAWLLLATIPSFLAVSDFGLATAAGTQMTMLVATAQHEAAVRIYQSARIAILASSAAVILIALGIVALLPDHWLPASAAFPAGQVRIALSLLLVYGVLALQGGIVMTAVRADRRFATATLWLANTVLVENLVVIALVLVGGNPVAVAACLLCARACSLALQNMLLRRSIKWLRHGVDVASWTEIKALVAPALAVAALPLAQASFLQGTAMALGIASSEAAVPGFTAARTLSRIGLQMTLLLTHALMPEFSAAVGRGDRAAQAKMLVVTIGTAALVAVPFAVLLAIGGPWLVSLWTRGIVVVSPGLMGVMAMTVVLGGFWFPASNLILAMNRQAGFSYPFVIFALLTVPASYFLARSMGATGAALAIAIMDLAMCIVVWRLGRRLFVSGGEMRVAAQALLHRAQGMMRRRH